MMKEMIIRIAEQEHGGYVHNGYGDWNLCDNPESLTKLIESFGFHVTKSYSTLGSCAVVETEEGYKIYHNGYVTKINGGK